MDSFAPARRPDKMINNDRYADRIWVLVFAQLEADEHVLAQRVCRQFKRVGDQPSSWCPELWLWMIGSGNVLERFHGTLKPRLLVFGSHTSEAAQDLLNRTLCRGTWGRNLQVLSLYALPEHTLGRICLSALVPLGTCHHLRELYLDYAIEIERRGCQRLDCLPAGLVRLRYYTCDALFPFSSPAPLDLLEDLTIGLAAARENGSGQGEVFFLEQLCPLPNLRFLRLRSAERHPLMPVDTNGFDLQHYPRLKHIEATVYIRTPKRFAQQVQQMECYVGDDKTLCTFVAGHCRRLAFHKRCLFVFFVLAWSAAGLSITCLAARLSVCVCVCVSNRPDTQGDEAAQSQAGARDLLLSQDG